MSITIDGTTGISGVAGTAGTPAVQGEDTNTGIFFPAADTIAFAEGGVEVARFDSNGRLGVGTTSPSAQVTIGRLDTGSEGGQIDLCRASDNASAWGIDAYGSTSTPSLRFVDNTAAAERMSIDGSGNLRFNSGYGSVATAFGCRAWVNFNGTNGAIRASGGVSSVTYNSTGQSTVSFTTAMPDVNYSVVCSGHSAGFSRQANAMPSSAGYATGSIVILYGNTINAAAENLSHVNVAVFR